MFGFKRKRKYQNFTEDVPSVNIYANNIINKGDNVIRVIDNQNLEIVVEGEGNQISIGMREGNIAGKVRIYIYGDNNVVTIGQNNIIGSLVMIIGQNHYNHGKSNNVLVTIGNNNSFGGVEIDTFNCHAIIYIGDECMFSSGITLYHSDGHPILDFETKKITNKVREMRIGNHCWIGKNATILKNSLLAEDSIVGFAAVVSGIFEEKHTVIAGNPAKVVKRGVTWEQRADGYIENEL